MVMMAGPVHCVLEKHSSAGRTSTVVYFANEASEQAALLLCVCVCVPDPLLDHQLLVPVFMSFPPSLKLAVTVCFTSPGGQLATARSVHFQQAQGSPVFSIFILVDRRNGQGYTWRFLLRASTSTSPIPHTNALIPYPQGISIHPAVIQRGLGKLEPQSSRSN